MYVLLYTRCIRVTSALPVAQEADIGLSALCIYCIITLVSLFEMLSLHN